MFVPSPPHTGKFLWLFLLCATNCWAQHSAHTHGRATLNVVLDQDREIVAELIAPADSVYGFEHQPRNPLEYAQMAEGLNRLKAALAEILVIEGQPKCTLAEIQEEGRHKQAEKQHGRHDHAKPKNQEDGHKHAHHDSHGEKEEHAGHHNVMVRWKLTCKPKLSGRRLIVNWHGALPNVHHIDLVLLTPDRQEAVDLTKSGSKVYL